MASLEMLAWSDLARSINIIGISTDDYPAVAKNWLGQSHATISQFIDTRLQMESMLGATRLPLTVLLGPDGRIIGKFYGARDWNSPQTRKQLRSLLGL
jgi:hypothetical protein